MQLKEHFTATALRFVGYTVAGLVSFVLGCVVTIFVLFRVFTPPENCLSPCDAPAYVALGVAVFVAPVIGVLFSGGAVYALSRLWPRKLGAAA